MFRHSEQAQSTETVCANWRKKQCTDECCPLRHPGSKESSSTGHNDQCIALNVPSLCKSEGLQLPSPPKPDFKSLTDCAFYIQGKQCKNGDKVRLVILTGTVAILNFSHISVCTATQIKLGWYRLFVPGGKKRGALTYTAL